MKTEDVRALLRKRFAPPEWALMEELAPRTGGGTGYADAVAMNLWQSRGHVVYGMEIKVSRSDWLRELKKPAKAESVFRYCDGWYVVVLPGVIQDGELPATWGMLEAHGGRLIEKVKAHKLDPLPPDRLFVASLMRRGWEQIDRVAEAKQRQAIAEASEKIQERINSEVQRRARRFEELQAAVKKWEDATGLLFDVYAGPSIKVIRLAQQLEEMRYRNINDLVDSGPFGFLGALADNLQKASQIVRGALSECDVAGDTTSESEAISRADEDVGSALSNARMLPCPQGRRARE